MLSCSVQNQPTFRSFILWFYDQSHDYILTWTLKNLWENYHMFCQDYPNHLVCKLCFVPYKSNRSPKNSQMQRGATSPKNNPIHTKTFKNLQSYPNRLALERKRQWNQHHVTQGNVLYVWEHWNYQHIISFHDPRYPYIFS